MDVILRASTAEYHACDPSVVRGTDGNYYLHYTALPNAVVPAEGEVAQSSTPWGGWTKKGATTYTPPPVSGYGRGETAVIRGHDYAYYLAMLSEGYPGEDNAIIILRSFDASFRSGVTEVTRFSTTLAGGLNIYSPSMAYDRANHRYLISGGNDSPAGRTLLNVLDESFTLVGRDEITIPGYSAGEGQGFVTDEYGELLTWGGNFWMVGATVGPSRNGYPLKVTGANIWYTVPASII